MSILRKTKHWIGVISLAFAPLSASAQTDTDLTIYVTGPLWELGGVIHVIPLPTTKDLPEGPQDITVSARYTEVQLRYPQDATYFFRFRPASDVADAEHAARFATQAMSIGGVGPDGLGAEMKIGFIGDRTSGTQTIRILPYDEYAQPEWPNWGKTQGHKAKPPADIRSARALMALIRHRLTEPIPQICSGTFVVQTCVIAPYALPYVEAQWWRMIAEQRLERLRHHALRHCYDNRSVFATGNCKEVPGSDEPEYE